MSFLSFSFAVFLGLGLLIFHLGPANWRPCLLLGLSYVFYLSWSPINTLLLAAVTGGVYATAIWIEKQNTEQGKRAWMALGVMALALLLFAFKSADWLIKVFFPHNDGAGTGDLRLVIVPLGLSYYIFKMLGYLLDVYWEVHPAQRNFVTMALYGAFFPQIVSGPIQRAQNFFDQIDNIKNPDASQFIVGLRRILFGLFKKVVIADRLSELVGNVYAAPSAFSSLELLVAGYCFAIQLYADLSGITDIAIGIGLLFGVKGPENFDLPFYSFNIQQFWRRWHMSLTTWLADYLFTPLRMSLRAFGTTGLCLAIFVNMVAIGLWHGVTWKFLTFGIIHGIFVTVSVLTLKRRDTLFRNHSKLASLHKIAAPVLTFHLVAFSLILFRAGTFSAALNYMTGLIPGLRKAAVPLIRFDLSMLGISEAGFLFCLTAFFVSEAVTWALRKEFWIERFFATPVLFRRTLDRLMFVTVLLSFKGSIAFIYARF